ncbi:NAD(P)-binding protein [Cryphonectria parasitica EP155]|uniref:NAD(P)-binding protein n=1 Tax=Cryphonectria parasitica (strain ATCC 38755 / EP155) TaxID=660469 RepID=A0A9P5CSF1_CRYP1|nr:NAD(P)-binding protein [Cryphonectria parasitica EP155]KAF3768080.1 NAD(P)-binding protein [Cryphonectria parasitica EP155]
MARIFITGSSDGLGALTAKRLIAQGHQVVLHARNTQRATDAQAACPGAHACLISDLRTMEGIKALAAEADRHGPYDCVVHNAGVCGAARSARELFTVNTLAPYVLTCLMARPRRLVYVSSELHRSGQARLDALEKSAYGDTKLHAVMLAKGVARRWAEVESNAVTPGWVPTKLGGFGAPGDIEAGVEGFVMLALGEGNAKGVTGTYFQQSKMATCSEAGDDEGLQDGLLRKCAEMSGVDVPQ